MGCGEGVTSAINWVFESEERVVILEDDCVPAVDFFPFISSMLEKFKDENRIMMISGRNELGEWHCGGADYFFSIGGIWGWATWKRAWNEYLNFEKYWTVGLRKKISNHEYELLNEEINEIEQGCKEVISGNLDTWDYQWAFVRLYLQGMSINPRVNLVSNVGFNSRATHTKINSEIEPSVGSLKSPFIENSNFAIDYEYLFRKRNKRRTLQYYLRRKKFLRNIKSALKSFSHQEKIKKYI